MSECQYTCEFNSCREVFHEEYIGDNHCEKCKIPLCEDHADNRCAWCWKKPRCEKCQDPYEEFKCNDCKYVCDECTCCHTCDECRPQCTCGN